MSYYIRCVCYFLILGNKCRVPTSTPMDININVRLPFAHLPQVPTSLKFTLQPLKYLIVQHLGVGIKIQRMVIDYKAEPLAITNPLPFNLSNILLNLVPRLMAIVAN